MHELYLWKDQLYSWSCKNINDEVVNKKYNQFTSRTEVFQVF